MLNETVRQNASIAPGHCLALATEPGMLGYVVAFPDDGEYSYVAINEPAYWLKYAAIFLKYSDARKFSAALDGSRVFVVQRCADCGEVRTLRGVSDRPIEPLCDECDNCASWFNR